MCFFRFDHLRPVLRSPDTSHVFEPRCAPFDKTAGQTGAHCVEERIDLALDVLGEIGGVSAEYHGVQRLPNNAGHRCALARHLAQDRKLIGVEDQ